MKKVAVLLACLLSLGGCVFQNMTKGLDALKGQNIQVAVNELGYPDGQRTMLGHTIYVWGRSEDTVLPTFNTSTTNGMIGNTPVYGTTTTTNLIPVNYNCTIQIMVDSNNIIQSWQFTGNRGGCSAYANDLKQNS